MGNIYSLTNASDESSIDKFAITLHLDENYRVVECGGSCKTCHRENVNFDTLPDGNIHVFCPECKSSLIINPANFWDDSNNPRQE
ncbi:MAG: hypothetical protein IJG38_15535 [Thermoguttaceae bacterium]|nr:hypothetical protein [Thermoguttaceae bacterium]